MMTHHLLLIFFFFFQAEDGIRDVAVTGVQTCALPIFAVPQTQREAALALGATRWETVRDVVVPYARSGILGSVFLALARALGETMAVTMVIGNRPEIAASLFAPAYTMAAVLANEFTEATDEVYLAALVEIALVLFAITLAVNALARLLIASVQRAPGAARP